MCGLPSFRRFAHLEPRVSQVAEREGISMDSHDRYANIEVAYLLQRVEAYRGLAILTTNMSRELRCSTVSVMARAITA